MDPLTLDYMIASRTLVILSGRADPQHLRTITFELIALLKQRYYQVSIPIPGEPEWKPFRK